MRRNPSRDQILRRDVLLMLALAQTLPKQVGGLPKVQALRCGPHGAARAEAKTGSELRQGLSQKL